MNTVGSYMCTCRAGYTGKNNGNCTGDLESFNCVSFNDVLAMHTAFTNNYYANIDIDECGMEPCPKNVQCLNTAGSFKCGRCLPGYTMTPLSNGTCTGKECSFNNMNNNPHITVLLLDMDECKDPKICPKHSLCINLPPGSYQCQCLDGFTGDPQTTGCFGNFFGNNFVFGGEKRGIVQILNKG